MVSQYRQIIVSSFEVFIISLLLVGQIWADPSLWKEASAKNPLIKKIKVVHSEGSRPRFSPDGKKIVFDQKGSDGFFHLFISNPEGSELINLTRGNREINQRNNGNGIFHPSGDWIVFVSEEEDHYLDKQKWTGDPGIGLFSNLWVTTPQGNQFWRLTNIVIKKKLFDRKKVLAVVNPLFSLDGKVLYWTERYANGGNNNWGKWRIKMADFEIKDGVPSLKNERVFFTPKQGTYVTLMGQFDDRYFLLSGNLDGQHEYGMDEYVLDSKTETLNNLSQTPEFWEEDGSVSPQGRVAYMSNKESQYQYNFNNASWHKQRMERDYYLTDRSGAPSERLTYFNDASAPEFIPGGAIVAASDFSPDGRFLVGTLGVDVGKKARKTLLKVVLIEFKEPL